MNRLYYQLQKEFYEEKNNYFVHKLAANLLTDEGWLIETEKNNKVWYRLVKQTDQFLVSIQFIIRPLQMRVPKEELIEDPIRK